MFTVLKILNLLKKYLKSQEVSYNFMLGFALSKRPHLHRAYAISECIFFATAVHFCQQITKKVFEGFHLPTTSHRRNGFGSGIIFHRKSIVEACCQTGLRKSKSSLPKTLGGTVFNLSMSILFLNFYRIEGPR